MGEGKMNDQQGFFSDSNKKDMSGHGVPSNGSTEFNDCGPCVDIGGAKSTPPEPHPGKGLINDPADAPGAL